MIKLGCCLPGGAFIPTQENEAPATVVQEFIAKCRFIQDCGFDYVECGATVIAQFTEEEWQAVLAEHTKKPLGIRAVSSLFPSTYHLYDPGEQWDEIISYLHGLIDRLVILGVQYVVFGSGKARSIPEGMDAKTCFENVRKVMCAFADYAEPKGITMVLEPLRSKESNIYNLVPVCAEEVRLVNRTGVKLLADSYHMAYEETPPEVVEGCAELLFHCHIAEAPDRTPPGIFTTGDPDYNRRFADALKKSGYSGGVSIECGYKDCKSEIPIALAYMRSIFAE